jgi:secondary thiamine-phosphate synthase enzyme
VKQHQETLALSTPGRGMLEVTREVERIVREAGVRSGLVTIHCAHTSASLVIMENADPDVGVDLLAWLERLAPDGDPRYAHDAEGPDDMPAHLRTAILRTNETLPIVAGRPALGTWQGIYLVEHRAAPHDRRLLVHVLGE